MKDSMTANIQRRQRLLLEAIRYMVELDQVRHFIGPDDHKAMAEWAKLYTAAFMCKLRTM